MMVALPPHGAGLVTIRKVWNELVLRRLKQHCWSVISRRSEPAPKFCLRLFQLHRWGSCGWCSHFVLDSITEQKTVCVFVLMTIFLTHAHTSGWNEPELTNSNTNTRVNSHKVEEPHVLWRFEQKRQSCPLIPLNVTSVWLIKLLMFHRSIGRLIGWSIRLWELQKPVKHKEELCVCGNNDSQVCMSSHTCVCVRQKLLRGVKATCSVLINHQRLLVPALIIEQKKKRPPPPPDTQKAHSDISHVFIVCFSSTHTDTCVCVSSCAAQSFVVADRWWWSGPSPGDRGRPVHHQHTK